MSLLVGMLTLVCIVLWITKGARGLITLGPSNAVSALSGQVVFHCEGSLYQGMWFLSTNGYQNQELFIVGPLCTMNTGFEAHYRTDTTGGTYACNIIVTNITMEQAGVYRCLEQDSTSALLTVIDSFPSITINNTQGVVENENVVITCTLNYNGSVTPAPTLLPYFYWTDSSGGNVSSSSNSTEENTAVSQLTATASRPNITSYTCHAYLQLVPAGSGGYANNIPNVDSSISSPVIEVLYPPLIPQILATSSGFLACEAKNLMCYSEANPLPNYNWLDLTHGNITNAQETVAEYAVNYTCNASNIIRNVIYFQSSMFYETSSANNTCKFPRSVNMHISGSTCTGDFCSCECSPATILCYVDSYPQPSYEWLLPDGSRVKGQTAEAMISGIFVCRTYTLIDGWYLVEAYRNINVSGCSLSVETTATYSTMNSLPSGCSACETAAIVLGVLLAISITAHVISFALFYRKGVFNRGDSTEREVAQPKSNSEELHYQDLIKETSANGTVYEELHN